LWEKAYQTFWWLERWGMRPWEVERLDASDYIRVPQIAAMNDEMIIEARQRG
jgi:hypothetical protein